MIVIIVEYNIVHSTVYDALISLELLDPKYFHHEERQHTVATYPSGDIIFIYILHENSYSNNGSKTIQKKQKAFKADQRRRIF